MKRARGTAKNGTRRYTQRARAAAAGQRRERVLQAAHDLLMTSSWDEVTLERVALRADVAVKTVVRQFGSKDALLVDCMRWRVPREAASRAVDPGDVEGAAHALAERYEEISPVVARFTPLEDKIPAVAQMLGLARAGHLDWLATVFAPWLPRRPSALRRARLAALFGATEMYVWHVWRRRLSWSRRVAQAAMLELLQSLTARWTREERKRA